MAVLPTGCVWVPLVYRVRSADDPGCVAVACAVAAGISNQLEEAIGSAARLHAADLADDLDAKWLVSEEGA